MSKKHFKVVASTDDIKLVKFNNGEEVLGEYSIHEGRITLKKPAKYIITQQGVALVPWVLSEDESFEFSESCVMFVANVDPELKSGYKRQVSNIIQSLDPGTLPDNFKLQ